MERQAWQVFGPRLKNIAWPSTTNTNSSSSSSSSGGSGGGLNTFPPTFPTLASSATASASSVPSAATSSALAAQQPARPPLLIKSWTCADTLHLLVSDLTQCWGCTLRAGPELRKQAGEFNRYVELDQRRLLRLLGSALALTDANAEFTLQAQGATTTPAPAAAVPQLELHLSTRAGPAQFKWIFRCAVQPPHVLFTHLTHPLMAMVADLKHRCRNYQNKMHELEDKCSLLENRSMQETQALGGLPAAVPPVAGHVCADIARDPGHLFDSEVTAQYTEIMELLHPVSAAAATESRQAPRAPIPQDDVTTYNPSASLLRPTAASAAAASAQLHAAAAPQAVFAGAAPAPEVASAVFDQATQDAAAPETTVNLMADAPTQDTLSSSPIRGQDPTDGSLSQAAGAAASSSAEPTSSLQDYAPKLQYDIREMASASQESSRGDAQSRLEALRQANERKREAKNQGKKKKKKVRL